MAHADDLTDLSDDLAGVSGSGHLSRVGGGLWRKPPSRRKRNVEKPALADTPVLGEWLDARLRYAAQRKAEVHLLSAAAPDGLEAAAGALDPVCAPGGRTRQLDVIGAAIGQLQANGYVADGVVLNGLDVS